MTRKQNKKSAVKNGSRVRQLEKQLAAVKIKAKTPFANAGSLVGARAGQMFNMPMLKGVGKWLGSGIGSIFGSGDYTLAGSSPAYNVLTNGSQIPKFSTNHATNMVCHREYLGDITGTAAFNVNNYPLNPGMATTFPWLSSIADNYSEYKFHGIIFEFRPLITDFVTGGAPGVVVMATNYNADLPVYTTKQQMENSEYAVSVKPTLALIHGIECDPAQTDPIIKYVRNSALATGVDLKNYDWGNFQFATQSNPIQNLGELWVSYCVEFFKPILTTTSGPVTVGNTYHACYSAFTNAAPLGTVLESTSGSMSASNTSTVLTITGVTANQLIQIDVFWHGSTLTAVTAPIVTFGNATAQLFYRDGNDNYVTAPNNAQTTTKLNYQSVIKATAAGSVTITFGGAGTLPTTSPIVDIWVSYLDATVTA